MSLFRERFTLFGDTNSLFCNSTSLFWHALSLFGEHFSLYSLIETVSPVAYYYEKMFTWFADMRRCDSCSPSPFNDVRFSFTCYLFSSFKLRHYQLDQNHGGYCGKEVRQSSCFPDKEVLCSGVYHPVLLPPEGNIFICITSQKKRHGVLVIGLCLKVLHQPGETLVTILSYHRR